MRRKTKREGKKRLKKKVETNLKKERERLERKRQVGKRGMSQRICLKRENQLRKRK